MPARTGGRPADLDVAQRSVSEANFAKCPACRGRKVDRFGFDCTTCFGEGEIDD